MGSPARAMLLKHVRNHRFGEQLSRPLQQACTVGAFLTHKLSAECDFNQSNYSQIFIFFY